MIPLAQSSQSTQTYPLFQTLMRRWSIFWTAMLYGMLLICIGRTLSERQLPLAELIFLFVLCIPFLLGYHYFFLPNLLVWPKPLRAMLVYFCTQFLLVSILMHFNRDFGLLCYLLLFQVAGGLPMALWPFPMLAASSYIALILGADHMLASGQWLELMGTLLYLLIWPAIAFFIYNMIQQRYRMQHLIDELHQVQSALLQQAQQAEELATLRERSRLAREMHDSIGHALVLLNIKLEAAQRLYALNEQRGARELEASRELIRTTMRDLRYSLANLRMPAELDQGLIPALRALMESSARQSGIAISYTMPESLPHVPAHVGVALWRVAREALMNVERHAAARQLSITLEQQERSLVMQICDDGRGICATDMAQAGHFGIVGMHEVAQQAGGFVDIRPGVHGGTCVTCTISVGSYDSASNTRADR